VKAGQTFCQPCTRPGKERKPRCSSSLYSRSLLLPLPEREREAASPTSRIEPIRVSYGFRRHGWLLQGLAPHLDDRRRLAGRSLWRRRRRRRLALPNLSAAEDQELGMAERALSAAGAAFVSAIIVNPLDVAMVSGPGLIAL
jgi:hypothetical protein